MSTANSPMYEWDDVLVRATARGAKSHARQSREADRWGGRRQSASPSPTAPSRNRAAPHGHGQARASGLDAQTGLGRTAAPRHSNVGKPRTTNAGDPGIG